MGIQNLNTRLSLAFLAILLCGGCFRIKAPEVSGVSKVKGRKGSVTWWKGVVEVKEKELAEAQAGLKKAKISRIERIMAWVIGLALLVVVACVVVFFTIPGLKKLCITLGVAGLVVAAFAFFLSWLAPYLLWIVLALVLTGLIIVLLSFRKESKALAHVVGAVNVIKSKAPGYKKIFNEMLSKASKKRIDVHREFQGV